VSSIPLLLMRFLSVARDGTSDLTPIWLDGSARAPFSSDIAPLRGARQYAQRARARPETTLSTRSSRCPDRMRSAGLPERRGVPCENVCAPAIPAPMYPPPGDTPMDPFETFHFSNEALIHNLRALVAHDCRTTAVLLTRIAEVEERKLFRQAGYSSMHAYCVHELHFSEGVAYKRTEAARVARRMSRGRGAVAGGEVSPRGALHPSPRA